MPRYALLLEYNGRPFSGWQRQAEHPSVQGALEAALARVQPEPAAVAAAGRTDAGVHATGQVAQADMIRAWDPFRLGEALNHHLRPNPVAVLAVAQVADGWHARFSAVERRYTYRILCRRAPPVLDHAVWHVRRRLDPEAMAEGARHLVGRHDFTTFRSTECQSASPVKTVDEVRVEAREVPYGLEIAVHVRARSFLHNQVRSFVGTLERVGADAWPPARVAVALAAADRAACGPVAPPGGLCLTGVRYPHDPFAA
ncbi:tRNA pseudouridine(38-40) synthase TruA [Roseitranquillus sediminis]|uniref:tRNA pseudouridine(38-40) synthase TruA n=1 Tax=Roseitranquillus sediminis TaxID=2809051 RepID=UPI001D0C2B7D|nr:tRNA pseudouridine(38-40) synthase TruA [Roseitranquillus sediminis]MBM9596396.1 tRNA pseudouridine(38-40) synthase TruA [Roseitranquillus sediminis]